MADVNANIGVNIDTTQALAQLKALQRQISQFHTSIAKSSETAALAQRDLQRNFINSINSIGAFSAELRTVKTTAESFTDSLEKNKFSMREYFRYAGGATKTFGKLFKSEFDTIGRVAEDRVKRLQTQYIKLGRDSSGAMKAIAVIPNELDMSNFSTQTQLAAQRQALFNQLIKQGSTNLLNFGKNTQWAGRQLMVGFTLPLATLGTTAARTFMEMEAAALKFRKVYGDLFTPKAETQAALQNIQDLGKEFTKYGISVSQTVGLAADAAAAGFQGLDLQRQTTAATRLSVLGQIDNQKALETTISLQNAFRMSSADLASSIDFLNAVENQTVVSLDDITTAIPKVAPVIKQLGGDVKDLAFFLAAMKEGGVNASEGANALKSGLAALINPTAKASDMLASMGINIKQIIETNKGDLKATVVGFAQALDTLDPLTRARAIEQLFGKFQFARLSTLFANVTKQSGQAARVLDLAGTSVEQLAALSEQELGITADSAMNKFRKSVEDMKLALVPVGQTFLQAVTPIVEFIGNILEKFNGLSDGVKKAIVVMTVAIGAIGPVALMTFGLLANGLANIVKGAMILRQGYLRLTGQTQVLGEQTDFLTNEQLNAAAVAHSLDQSHAKLVQTFNVERQALEQLIVAYQAAASAGARFAAMNPGMMMPPRGKGFNKGTMRVKKYNNGVKIVPGSGNTDTVAAMLTPGEAVIPKDRAQQYAPLIEGIIAGSIPGFMAGTVSVGGQTTGLDFARKDTAAKAQQLVDAMLAEGSGIENALAIVNETLARMANDTQISIGSFVREIEVVTKELTGSLLPKGVLVAGGRPGERKFSAGQTNVGTMEEQVRGNVALEEELKRARESSKVAQEAMQQYYEGIGIDLTQTDKKTQNIVNAIKQSGEVHRAHIIEMQDNVDKMFDEAWDPKAWVAQSSTLNQVSNILDSSTDTRNEYLSNLNKVNASEAIVASITEKVTNNIALTEQELVVQKQVLERMLASTESMAKLSPSFKAQATGAIAATDYLIQNPATQAGVGSRTEAEMLSARQSITAARFRGQQSFGAITEEARALTDQVVLETARAAGTQSPSKRTIPIGEDIARGLSVGMMNQADDVARAAASVANQAIEGMRPSGLVGPNGQPLMVPITPQSAPVGALAENAAISPETKNSIKEEVKARKSATAKLYGMNKALMSGTFALTAIAGAGSMAGGVLGDLSQQIMKYSGLLFGLMTVTQMLTQESFLLLLARRKQAATSALGAMPAFTRAGAGAGLMAGLKNFGKYLVSAGSYVLRFGRVFLGLSNPVGWIVTGLTLTASLIFASNKQRQKELAAMEALGKAAHIAASELEALKGATGASLTKTAFEAPTMFGVSVQNQDQIQQFQTAIKDSKELMARVEALKGATAGQAAAVLQSFGIELIARGMDPKTTQNFIKALADMSGKAGVIATAKIELDTVDLKQELSGTVTIFDKAFNPALAAANKGGKDLEKNLSLVAGVAASAFNVLSSQFSQGNIDAKQFNNGVAAIKRNVDTLGKTQALYVLRKALVDVNPQMSLVVGNIKSGADAFKLLQMGAMGVNLSGFIAQIQAAGTVTEELRAKMDTVFGIAGRLAALKSQLAAAEAANAAGQAGTGTGGDTGGAASKEDPRLAYLRKAQAKLTIAAILEVEKPAEKDFKNRVNTIVESINKELKAVNVDLQIDPKSIKNIGDIDIELKRINMDIEKAITPAYRAAQFQVEDLKDSTEKYAHENEIINHQLDGMEKFYAKQKDALAEVGRLEAYNNAQRKRQITLADALTSGDISAAAQAAQEMQAAQAEFANETQQKALENNPELLALREQIAANDEKIWQINQQIYDIQQKSIDPVDKQIRQYERQKTLLNDMNSDYQTAIEYAKAKLKVDGMSAAEIEREIALRQAQLDLAGQGGGTVTAGVAFKPIDTSKIKAEIAALEAELGKNIPTDEPITNWFQRQWIKVTEIWGKFKKWWKENVWDPFSQSPVGNWFEDRWNNMKNIWSRFSNWWSENITTPLKNKWNDAMSYLGTKWNSFKENMGVLVETGAALFRATQELWDELVVQPLKTKWTQFAAWVGPAVIEPLKTKWNEFKTWFGTTILEPIKTKWNEFTGWFGTNVIEPVKNKWNDFKSWIDTNLIQPVRDKFAVITQPFKDAIEKIGVWWDDWKTKTFDQKVETFKNMFKSIFDPETWKSWFNGALSLMGSAFKGFINNTLISGLNSIRLTIPSSIFGVRVPIIGGQSWGFNIPQLAEGGMIPGSGNSDNYPALLTPGEFVVNKNASKKFEPILQAMNNSNGSLQDFVSNRGARLPRLSAPSVQTGARSGSPMTFRMATYNATSSRTISPTTTKQTTVIGGSSDLYNYNVNINVRNGANANDIANSVITQIKQIDSQRIRGNRAS